MWLVFYRKYTCLKLESDQSVSQYLAIGTTAPRLSFNHRPNRNETNTRMQIGKVMGRQVYTNTGKELEMLRRFSERMIDEIYRGKISLSQANSSSCIGGHSLIMNVPKFMISVKPTTNFSLQKSLNYNLGKVARKTLLVNGVKNI